MSAFSEDYRWQRAYLPEVKRLIAQHLIVEAPFEEDARRNTDLIVLKLDAVRVACRIRRQKYASRYCDEFTIRATRPNGTETELAKVLSGWGDYIFYGFASTEPGKLNGWVLGDLNVFRLWHHRELVRLTPGQAPGVEQPNKDGSSLFRAYRIDNLPSNFVIARERPTLLEVA